MTNLSTMKGRNGKTKYVLVQQRWWHPCLSHAQTPQTFVKTKHPFKNTGIAEVLEEGKKKNTLGLTEKLDKNERRP